MSGARTGPPELTLPFPSVLTRHFWEECRRHRLSLQRCDGCARFRFYPTAACPSCAASQYNWAQVSGRGTIYSWIVVRRTHDPYWQHAVPYVCAIVELVEQPGLLMPGLLTGVEPAHVHAGMPVEVVFEEASPSISLPRWRARLE